MIESFKKAFGTVTGFVGGIVAINWLVKAIKEEAKTETKAEPDKETGATDDDFLE